MSDGRLGFSDKSEKDQFTKRDQTPKYGGVNAKEVQRGQMETPKAYPFNSYPASSIQTGLNLGNVGDVRLRFSWQILVLIVELKLHLLFQVLPRDISTGLNLGSI